MSIELLKKDEQGNVTGYQIYRTTFKKKENLVTTEPTEINVFKCVAGHKDYVTLVQAVVTYRELIDINSSISRLEEKQLQEFALDEKDTDSLRVLYARKQCAEKLQEKLEIPVSFANRKITEYPQNVLLLANWIDGVIPQFPVEKIKTLVAIVTNAIINTGVINIDDELVANVKDVLDGFYKQTYSTVKDSIFKKWILKFDLVGIRQLILSCGIVAKLETGAFKYVPKSDDDIRKNVTHALLRRMQKDNAESDKSDKTDKKTSTGKEKSNK